MDSSQRRGALLLELVALVVFVVSLAGLAAYYNWFTSIDRFLYDRVITVLAGETPDDIVVVGIDEQSLRRFGRWPWRRPEQARLFRAIGAAGPREVLVDIVYSEPTNTTADGELREALGNLPGLALPMVIDAVTESGQLIEVLPLPQLMNIADSVAVYIYFRGLANRTGRIWFSRPKIASFPNRIAGGRIAKCRRFHCRTFAVTTDVSPLWASPVLLPLFRPTLCSPSRVSIRPVQSCAARPYLLA